MCLDSRWRNEIVQDVVFRLLLEFLDLFARAESTLGLTSAATVGRLGGPGCEDHGVRGGAVEPLSAGRGVRWHDYLSYTTAAADVAP